MARSRDEAEASKIGDAQFLAQSTLWPVVIEAVSFTAGEIHLDDIRRPASATRSGRPSNDTATSIPDRHRVARRRLALSARGAAGMEAGSRTRDPHRHDVGPAGLPPI
jgi:hypothetical protein